MFYSLTGKLTYLENNQAAVDVNGVAYLCNVSFNTFRTMRQTGSEVTLYTYLKVSEDALDLYGFASKDELEAFKMLITVSGVGPKAALSILSELTPSQLYLAIAGGDLKKITAAQGAFMAASVVADVGTGTFSEAVSALVILGYSQSEASIAVSRLDPSLPLEEMIKQALKHLG